MKRKSSGRESNYAAESYEIWEANAAWWDDRVGEGNQFQTKLIGPATDRLLRPQERETILDIACGNGNYARHLADLGAQVVACDFSSVFIERAKERSIGYEDRIMYQIVDVTKKNQLLALGSGRYDAAVCTMALMDITTIEPLASALQRLLKTEGRFVFSITHPCFNSGSFSRVIEEEDKDGKLVETPAIKVVDYRDEKPRKGLGIIGQPEAHYYYHRTLTSLMSTFFDNGFVLDGLEEPFFEPSDEARSPFSWSNFSQIPPVLVARLRLR